MTLSINLTRRQFTSAAVAATALLGSSSELAAIESSLSGSPQIEPGGVLIRECSLPGETRADGVVPRHANCLQLSRDRWLIIYSTHGYRGVDDERSIVYQIRADQPDGRLLKEGFFSRAMAGWKPEGVDLSGLEPNQMLFKQHGHMVAFGVPAGAKLDGKPISHAGLFVAKWRTLGRVLDREKNFLLHSKAPGTPGRATQAVEWIQFRFDPGADDLKIVQPVTKLRQVGFQLGTQFCRHASALWMNQSFTPPIAISPDGSQWADCNHFDGGRLAVLQYEFDQRRGLFQWNGTGPLISAPNQQLMEASLAQQGDQFIIATRLAEKSGVGWIQLGHRFGDPRRVNVVDIPHCNAPLTAFTCADGVLRLFSGDGVVSPHKNARDPLYCWDIDPAARFSATNPRVIFDSVQAGLPIRPEVKPKIDFCELFPPHGREQLVAFGVSTRAYHFPYENRTDIPAVNENEIGTAGIYYARMKYESAPPPRWTF